MVVINNLWSWKPFIGQTREEWRKTDFYHYYSHFCPKWCHFTGEITPSLDKPKSTTEMTIGSPSCPRCELSHLLPWILAFLLPNLPTAIFAICKASDLDKNFPKKAHDSWEFFLSDWQSLMSILPKTDFWWLKCQLSHFVPAKKTCPYTWKFIVP